MLNEQATQWHIFESESGIPITPNRQMLATVFVVGGRVKMKSAVMINMKDGRPGQKYQFQHQFSGPFSRSKLIK